MTTYIGAENIISPLGITVLENFNQIKNNKSGIAKFYNIGINKEDVFISKFEEKHSFYQLLSKCLRAIDQNTNQDLLTLNETRIFISTTKADIEENISNPIINPLQQLQKEFKLQHSPITISNACISGVLAMNTANNYIKNGLCKYAFVIGADIVSDFVLYGFQSLYAISDEPCRPFDENRKGITLGEGAAGVLMSSDSTVFKNEALEFVEGTSSNDANHISGPSRTGEGLYRTIQKTMELTGIKASEIDYISAHGTGTNYNDEMESIAFSRLNMSNIPLNSLKGFFGHTLGAAGLIESAISIQSLRHNLLIKSLGYTSQGTSELINVLTENKKKSINTILKTASGFGGCNASAIIRKI